MAEDIEPTPEEVVEDAQSQEEPEVEAHSAEAVLGLQGIEDASQAGVIDDPAAGSCSSCAGSLCS
ncbi:hypothetical protein ACFYXC_32535 [Streptomyces sp. NPDC002701]|uniref:hypothetical protein n=1 Tax=unclassified Streptomyces TaxID=2593676 RepID=UPI0036955EA9